MVRLSDLRTWLLDLLRRPTPTGTESDLHPFLARLWSRWADEVHTDPVGNLYARMAAPKSVEAPFRLLVTAHMDTVGLVVSQVEGAWLRLRPIGGLDARVLPGQRVWVRTRRGGWLPGVVAVLPDALRPESRRGKPPRWEDLRIDLGLPATEVAQRVAVGAVVTFDAPPLALDEHLITAPGLDNRASLAAMTAALALGAQLSPAWEVWFVATVQEEISLGGAAVAAHRVHPHVALVVDVTFGQAPGTPATEAFPLGQGVTLGWGAHMHPGVYRHLRRVAEAHNIPWQTEYLPMRSGTEAGVVQLAREGIPTALISIPLRYMHTPVETVDLRDIWHAARLLQAYMADLDEHTLEAYRP